MFSTVLSVRSTEQAPLPKIYETEAGVALIKDILGRALPYEPHDYTIWGILAVLDGNDLVAIAPTGSGKTTFFLGAILTLRELAAHPELCLENQTFPGNPLLLILCPTLALQREMNTRLTAAGVNSLVINSETLAEAATRDYNLWDAAVETPSAVILSPEQLRADGFRQLLNNKVFYARVVILGVDELHLLHHWGKSLRPAFTQIGQVRLRLPAQRGSRRTPLLGVTATLRAGPPWDSISKTLAFDSHTFRLIHKSNLRPNVRFFFRPMSSGINGTSFPELDWVLESGRRTVIFCKTIALSFRVACYLLHKAKQFNWKNVLDHIRIYNSLNSATFNTRTLELLESNALRVVISTDALSVGWNPPGILDVILVGDIEDPDELLQKGGRVNREGKPDVEPRIIWYHSSKAVDNARESLADPRAASGQKRKAGASSTAELDPDVARLLTGTCIVSTINTMYANGDADTPCGTCSQCLPEIPPGAPAPSKRRRIMTNTAAWPASRTERITKAIRPWAVSQLKGFRMRLYETAAQSLCLAGPSMLFDDDCIQVLLDELHTFLDAKSPRISSILDPFSKCLDVEAQESLSHFLMNLREEVPRQKAEVQRKKEEEAARKAEDAEDTDQQGKEGEEAVQYVWHDDTSIELLIIDTFVLIFNNANDTCVVKRSLTRKPARGFRSSSSVLDQK